VTKKIKRPATPLMRLVRFADLKAAGIVRNRTQLAVLIDTAGFPPGFWLSDNVRCWQLEAVERWVAARPTARPGPKTGFGRDPDAPIKLATRRKRPDDWLTKMKPVTACRR
jgi:hypothetical protein